MSAWALVTAQRSIVSMVDVMDPSTRGAHDAYHRLVRAGSRSLTACFFALAKLMVALVPDPSRVTLYLDDTLFHRNGPKVGGQELARCAEIDEKERRGRARAEPRGAHHRAPVEIGYHDDLDPGQPPPTPKGRTDQAVPRSRDD
ncbi:MAG: transposase [Acidimicrobiales bacterium]